MTPNAIILSLIAGQSLEAELVDQLSELADYPLFLVSNLRRGTGRRHSAVDSPEPIYRRSNSEPDHRLPAQALPERGNPLVEHTGRIGVD